MTAFTMRGFTRTGFTMTAFTMTGFARTRPSETPGRTKKLRLSPAVAQGSAPLCPGYTT
jgi:hypothetical protein